MNVGSMSHGSVPRAVMLASERGEVGLPAGMQILAAGGRAVDAVETAIRVVELNLEDHYVGVGGIPNLMGVVELDASIMDGRTRAVGAVGALQGYPHAISVARRVLDDLPQHVLLVGEGAARFAAECGFERGELLTDEARRIWEEGLDESTWDEDVGPGDRRLRRSALERIRGMDVPAGPLGTVNVLALDRHGDLCVGVSTSGYPWKYPGRLGDTPIVGAGNYCDNRAGGAGCTGRGELAIRLCLAKSVVDGLARGLDPEAACVEALGDAASLADEFRAPLLTIALSRDGSHGAAATLPGATYAVLVDGASEPEIIPRRVV